MGMMPLYFYLIMTNHPHKTRLSDLIKETHLDAANILNEWDYKALEWNLTPESIVWEVGAYKGRWALQICQKYNPYMMCFEPQVWAADVCAHVLEPYNARVFNYALGNQTDIMPMTHHETDGCSFSRGFDLRKKGALVKMRDMLEVKRELLPDKDIDLMMMNIEGYEYILIPYMFECGIYPKQLAVQFHADLLGSEWHDEVREMIKDKYINLWDYGLTLSGWRLK